MPKPPCFSGNERTIYHRTREELGLFKYLAEAKSVTRFFKRVDECVKRLGFGGYSLAQLTTSHDASATIGNVVPALQRIYIEEDFHQYDFAVKHALLSDEFMLISQIREMLQQATFQSLEFNRNRDLLAVMERFGHHNYWNNAFLSHSDDQRTWVAFGAAHLNAEEFKRRAHQNAGQLIALSKAIDQIGTQKYQSHFDAIRNETRVKIHPKAGQLIKALVKHRYRLCDAARETDIPIKTAESLIAAAKDTLGETTLSGLVLKAVKIGLATPD